MSAPKFTRSKDGRERATVHVAIRIDKAMVQWIAGKLNISESTALLRIREKLGDAVKDWEAWHKPFINENGDLEWAHTDDVHELEEGSVYGVTLAEVLAP